MASYRFQFGFGFPPVIKKLMILMGAFFLLQMVVSHRINLYLGLVPLLVWKQYFLWQLVTYLFLHGGLAHLFFNLLALWWFGGELENYWGAKRFLFYFFFCGIGAALCTVIFTPYQMVPVIGASGAIYGILLAFGWLFPNRPIYLYFLLPIPAKYMVILFGLLSLFSSMEGTGGGIAHLTHLGGLLFGLLYMAFPWLQRRIRREYYKWKWKRRRPDRWNGYH